MAFRRGAKILAAAVLAAAALAFAVPAVASAGLTGIHLHDLRHAGNTFTANAGANLRELMDRMGHDSQRGQR